MKKIILIPFILLCMILFTVPAFAMKNEPDNFRGIPWGASAKKKPGLGNNFGLTGFIKPTDSTTLYYRNEEVSIGGAEISSPIAYFFHDSLGFCRVTIVFQGSEQYNLLYKICHETWGNPDENRRKKNEDIKYDFEEIFWVGEQVYAKLEYYHDFLGTHKTGEGTLSITLNNLAKTLEKEEATQKQKEDGF